MKTAIEAIEEIKTKAKKSVVREMRTIELTPDGRLLEPKTGKIGYAVRQGDIYIHLVDQSHERGVEISSRQLAVGKSKGSRHVAQPPAQAFDGIRKPSWCRVGALLGPCVVATQRFEISHPEHAHCSMPAGVYQVTHQMDARTQERVID